MDFSNLPQALRSLILPGQNTASVNSGNSFAVQIKSVPDAVLTQMKQAAQEMSVQGRVTNTQNQTDQKGQQQKADSAPQKNEITLRTPQGDIRITVPPQTAQLFKTGDALTLKLPLTQGGAPQNATVTIGGPATPTQPQQPTIRAATTPLNVNVVNTLQTLMQQGQTTQALATLIKALSSQPVRLQPLQNSELPDLRQSLLSQTSAKASVEPQAFQPRPSIAASQAPQAPVTASSPQNAPAPALNTGASILNIPSAPSGAAPQITATLQTTAQSLPPAPTSPSVLTTLPTSAPSPSSPPQAITVSSVQPPATNFISPSQTTIPSPQNLASLPSGQAGTVQATVKAYTPAHQPVLQIQSHTTQGTPQSAQFSFAGSNAVTFTPGAAAPITSASGLMVLPVTGEILPIGTQLSLRPASLSVLPNTTAGAPLSPSSSPLTFLKPQLWPTLDEALQTLAQAAPASAQAMTSMIPSANSPQNIMPTTLFFIAAMRSGDISSWMGGKAVDTLRTAGRGDLLSRLGSEASAASRLSADGALQDFKAITLPFMQDGQVHKIALYYKRDDDNEADGADRSQTRFIFDLSMSAMGKVQIDGLLGQKKLDLILRTEDIPAAPMRETMRARYSAALEASGLKGSLSFQNTPEGFFTPTPTPEFLNIDTK